MAAKCEENFWMSCVIILSGNDISKEVGTEDEMETELVRILDSIIQVS
jgi:hypothetical protein